MSGLKDIPITPVETVLEATLANGNALPVLHEIEALLRELVASGRTGSIDLRSLPMLPGDYEKLWEALGQGEVSATVEALGPTQVHETAVHGVWWVTHRNAAGDVVSEFIEVTCFPEILKTHPADARVAVETLRAYLSRSAETEGDDDVGQHDSG